MSIIIETRKLSHVYSQGTPFETPAVLDMDFEAKRGEFLGIIGHTGSGKSSLIQHLNGLLKPTSGQVLFNGKNIWESRETTRTVRFKVGLVFQYPEYQLFEETVRKDIAFGPKNMKLSESETEERVRLAARFVELPEEVLGQSPFELSGGQKRRAAIAGVIAMLPEVLILDEPTAGLDPGGSESILSNIRAYHEETGATVILVTHSMEDVARLADRLVVIEKGAVAMSGTPAEVFSKPEELSAMGLAVPKPTLIAMKLRALGLPLDKPVYTTRQAVDAIMALRGGEADA